LTRFSILSRSLVRVRSAWKAYEEHLNKPYPVNQPGEPLFVNERNDLFADILYEMASALDYDEYDKNECKKLSYLPQAHMDADSEGNVIRRGFSKVFPGGAAIPIYIVNEAPQEPTKQVVPSSPT
jgi:hypothetical protein